MEMTSLLGTSLSNTSVKPMVNNNSHALLPLKKSRRVITLTCYTPKPSSQDENNNRPTIHGDWRTSRAKLAPRERSSKPLGTSNLVVNPKKPIEDHHAHVTNEDSWAHILEVPERGCLLMATEKLNRVNIFKGTVILILSIDSKFSTGIIPNKPSSITISTVKDTMDGPLYFGGPLDEKSVLASLRKNSDGDVVIPTRSGLFEEMIEGLYYGTKQESFCYTDEMVKRNEIGVEDFRVFERYCKWTNKILRDEIRTGHWKVIACIPNTFSPLNG